MKTYELPVNALPAALLCAAKKDVREYLVGVLIDRQAGRIVGSDGSLMFVGQVPTMKAPSVLLPRTLVERALKTCPKRAEGGIFVEAAPGAVTLKHADGSFTENGSYVDDGTDKRRFFNYERVIPETVSGIPGHYNPELLARGQNALNMYAGNRHPRFAFVGYNGDTAPCVMTLDNATALVVVMPCRAGEPASRDWMRQTAKSENPTC